MLEYRPATGDAENFLGTGSSTFRAMLIASTIMGDFGPHLNVGYERRNSDLDADQIDLYVGYDQKIAQGLTLATDFMGEFEVGGTIQELQYRRFVSLERPAGTVVRTINLTNIPNFSHDNNLNVSVGLKFSPKPEFILIGNVIAPLNEGGLRSDYIATAGFQVGL